MQSYTFYSRLRNREPLIALRPTKGVGEGGRVYTLISASEVPRRISMQRRSWNKTLQAAGPQPHFLTERNDLPVRAFSSRRSNFIGGETGWGGGVGGEEEGGKGVQPIVMPPVWLQWRLGCFSTYE